MEKFVDVSVIIPYFKAKKTIIRALDSVFNQTALPNEVIIIDDFSDSVEDDNLLNYIDHNYRVKILKLEKNMGAGAARNEGLKVASSKYIAFLDSDDTWSNTKLEIQYDIMETTNTFISTHHTVISGEVERKTNEIFKITPNMQLIKNRFATRAVMVKNNDLYYFENGKRYAEDYLLWTQILFDMNSAIYIDKTLAYSYKEDYGESGLTGNLKKMYFGILDTYKILKKERIINTYIYALLIIYQTAKHFYRGMRMYNRKK